MSAAAFVRTLGTKQWNKPAPPTLHRIKVTTRNFQVLLKKSHDSSDDHKFPVTANETAIFM